MLKVILTHFGCFDLKPLLTDPPHKSSNWFCHCQPQPLCKGSESKLKLFHAARVADSQPSWKHLLMLMISTSDSPLMGSTPTFMSDGGWAGLKLGQKFLHFLYRKKLWLTNYVMCSSVPLTIAEHLGCLTLKSSSGDFWLTELWSS